jgi:hypothetical protein
MNMKAFLITIGSLVLLHSPLSAGKKIRTITDKEIESDGRSFESCEAIYQTCVKKDSCKECDHCACLPHCSCSDDCIALCKDDVINYYPAVSGLCKDETACAFIVAVAYPPAHLFWHFEHANITRTQPESKRAESKKME